MMTPFTFALSLTTGLFAGPLLALACSKPDPDGIALVIAPPWIDREAAVEVSNGRLIGPTSAWFGVFAQSPDLEFSRTAKENGVWFVVDGTAIASICGVTL